MDWQTPSDEQKQLMKDFADASKKVIELIKLLEESYGSDQVIHKMQEAMFWFQHAVMLKRFDTPPETELKTE